MAGLGELVRLNYLATMVERKAKELRQAVEDAQQAGLSVNFTMSYGGTPPCANITGAVIDRPA